MDSIVLLAMIIMSKIDNTVLIKVFIYMRKGKTRGCVSYLSVFSSELPLIFGLVP